LIATSNAPRAVENTHAQAGCIDILFNNAGYSLYGLAEGSYATAISENREFAAEESRASAYGPANEIPKRPFSSILGILDSFLVK
jgi:NAD(P)-dependent dehydrogenase (short-subunit alcohol dehydrogenase family)